MNTRPSTDTTQRLSRQSPAAEIQIVTWDDFFPHRQNNTTNLPARPRPAEPQTAPKSSARILLERIMEVDARSTNDEPSKAKKRHILARRNLRGPSPDDAESPLLHLAVAELQVGNRSRARDLLQQVLKADKYSERGWFWMAEAVDSVAEQRFCLEQVLSINRRNALARRRLKTLASESITIQSPEPGPV